MAKGKKLVDVTDKILESPVLKGRLRAYDHMMKTNKEPYIWEGRGADDDKRAAWADKIFKKRN